MIRLYQVRSSEKTQVTVTGGPGWSWDISAGCGVGVGGGGPKANLLLGHKITQLSRLNSLPSEAKASCADHASMKEDRRS